MNNKFWSKAHAYEEAGAYKMAIINLLMAQKKMSGLSDFINFDIIRLGKFECEEVADFEQDFIAYEAGIEKQIKKIQQKKLFNEKWFLENYREINLRGFEPVEFFVRFGNFLKLDPNSEFSTDLYLKMYPGKWSLSQSALYRFINRGCKYEYSANTLFAADEILRNSTDSNDIFKICKNIDVALTNELKYTSAIIKANEAINAKKEKLWLDYFNDYLSNVSKDKIHLKEGSDSVFDRLESVENSSVSGGDLVTVIMPAWNAGKTIKKSIESILNQTWQNIELIIVDDASTDNTWDVLCEYEKKDSRVKILKNKKNVGPYVSKNIGLKSANGVWVTGHDADDYALPSRIEEHVKEAVRNNYDASITYMIRMRPDGFFDHLGKIGGFSFDGVARKASITCLFKRKILIEKLGYWDSVRYGADSELIDRAQIVLGEKFGVIQKISMICLSLETSLTNHPVTGVRTVNGMSAVRALYRNNWSDWHKNFKQGDRVYLDFPLVNRPYLVPSEMDVV